MKLLIIVKNKKKVTKMLAYSLVKDDMNVGDLLKVCGYIVCENDRYLATFQPHCSFC